MGHHDKPEFDEATGYHTTGHVWDGDLKELNKPLPKWWLYTFYVCIVWAIGYMVLYPAWPLANDYTRGMLGFSQRATVMAEVEAGKDRQKVFRDKLAATPLDKVKSDEELLRFARAGGKAAFGTNCAPCHGSGAQGGVGYPNLNDDDWIWGGSVEAVQQTIQHGIRWQGDGDTRVSDMPKFGVDGVLDNKQIGDVAEFVLAFSGKGSDKAAAERGKAIWEANACAGCHGEKGEGNPELGAPSLNDAIWLYGGSKDAIVQSIHTGRGGVMPSWKGRLDDVTIKSLAVYVHTLGGGK